MFRVTEKTKEVNSALVAIQRYFSRRLIFQPITLVNSIEDCVPRVTDVEIGQKFTVLERLWVSRDGVSEGNTDQNPLTIGTARQRMANEEKNVG